MRYRTQAITVAEPEGRREEVLNLGGGGGLRKGEIAGVSWEVIFGPPIKNS